MPLLKTPPASTATPRRRQSGNSARRPTIEQGVAPGDQHAVQVAALHAPGERGRGVHPGADGPDHALGPEPGQGRVGFAGRLLQVVVGVVDEHDVHPVEPEPLQALLQGCAALRPRCSRGHR